MKATPLEVADHLVLFRKVALETGSDEKAMLAVLTQARRWARRRTRDLERGARLIVEGVCREMGVSRRELIGRHRPAPLVHARWVAMQAMREAGYSLIDIGLYLGRRHHTVMFGLRRIGARPELLQAAERVVARPLAGWRSVGGPLALRAT